MVMVRSYITWICGGSRTVAEAWPEHQIARVGPAHPVLGLVQLLDLLAVVLCCVTSV